MAGIYFHIPFCKQACHYCDFHFSTSLKQKEAMLEAMRKEIKQQAGYLQSQTIHTLYFGGGTPSLLAPEEIMSLLDTVAAYFTLATDLEVTLEANPDDLSREKIHAYRTQTPINRFSVGIQSFFEEDLRWMNRAHSAEEAESVVHNLHDAGFDNITADLIYGYPLLSDDKWTHNIGKLIDFDIPHLSAYNMTVENRTALGAFIRKGKERAMDEDQGARQFIQLVHTVRGRGYDHYEISNFSKPGHLAQHNTNYWKGVPYLGIGPSAHSFNGKSRQWNIRNNAQYINSINENKLPFESEILSRTDRLNEYIMTALRTKWGINFDHVQQHFGQEEVSRLQRGAAPFIANAEVHLTSDSLILSDQGKLLADHISAMLFAD